MSLGGEINRGAPGAQERSQAADVIGVFVGDDNAVEAINRMSKGGKAPQRFALPQARVHQQARPGSFKQSAIARTARRENAHAKADGFSPESCTPARALFLQHGGSRPGSPQSPDADIEIRAGGKSEKISRPHASSQKRRARVNAI
jgi:hypothetical protein